MVEGFRDRVEVVVCATDFSENAEEALAAAVVVAKRHSAQLVLAHVVEPIPTGTYPMLQPWPQEMEIEDWARGRLEAAASVLLDEGLSVSTRLERGHPGTQLSDLIEDVSGDLMVVGTRGLTGLKSVAMGSTAEALVRMCSCPVLTIHPGDAFGSDPMERILLPTDLSGNSMRAMEVFVSMFAPWQRPELTLLYAERVPPYLDLYRHDVLAKAGQHDARLEQLQSEMAPFAKMLEAADFRVKTLVLDGDPVNVTTDYAREMDASLIVLATHGRSAFANVLLGRTAQRIVHAAPCPVLSVRTESL